MGLFNERHRDLKINGKTGGSCLGELKKVQISSGDNVRVITTKFASVETSDGRRLGTSAKIPSQPLEVLWKKK